MDPHWRPLHEHVPLCPVMNFAVGVARPSAVGYHTASKLPILMASMSGRDGQTNTLLGRLGSLTAYIPPRLDL